MEHEKANWELIQQLFFLAEETPEAERIRILHERCGDPALIARAMDLVESSETAARTATLHTPESIGLRMGPYALLRPIGSGGLGTVYLGERMIGGAPYRAAVKVLAPHAAGPAFVERFHREQHILASLDHPRITKLLDAGLNESGQPYFAMEYVDGEHLDQYCDTHKLGIRERIDIFLRICEAVAYAHRNLVVHLDLKPSNILVTRDGEVKLLDFGTSKLVQAGNLVTTTILATPAYASPEQLLNQPVTTSCDLYSLGAILYELLSGNRPHRSGPAYFERAMEQREPEPLSAAIAEDAPVNRGVSLARLRAELTGDLATITAKCLRSLPGNRYASVDALSEDLRRHLEGKPVLARPQTVAYRVGRFLRRNRTAVAATVAGALLAIATLAYAGWRQEQALVAGQRALRMQTFLYSLFRIANSHYTGKPAATVPEFLSLGIKLAPRYIQDPADLRSAKLSLAESMFENGAVNDAQKVFEEVIAGAHHAGDVEEEAEAEAYAGNIAYQNGEMEKAAALTAQALALSKNQSVSDRVRVLCEDFYAENRENNGFRTDENLQLLEDAVRRSKAAGFPAHEAGDALYGLASDLELRGRLDEAEPIYREALTSYGDDPSELCSRSNLLEDLAYLYEMRGDPASALPIYKRSVDGFTACSGSDSRDALQAQDYYAGALIKLGRSPEAVPLLEAGLPGWRKIVGSSPDLAEVTFFLAEAYDDVGRFKDAEKIAAECIQVQTGKVKSTDRRVGAAHLVMARALEGQGRLSEALTEAEAADSILKEGAVSPGAKAMTAQAHAVLLEIQSKLHS